MTCYVADYDIIMDVYYILVYSREMYLKELFICGYLWIHEVRMRICVYGYIETAVCSAFFLT